jgi:GT2 family glycosyltransferase
LDLSIIIINWNTRELLLECLATIYLTITGVTFEIWLVDNGSSDGSVEAVRRKYTNIHIIQNTKNLGFAAANNLAFKKMMGRYALLLNTDTALTDGAVSELYNFMEKTPTASIACGQLLNPDGSKQNSIANFPALSTLLTNETLMRILFPKKFPSKRKKYTSPVEVDSCIGACMIVRKKAMDEVGYLDERYFFFFEETDWALRMKRAGWKIYFVPQARIFHAQGKSVGQNIKSRILFYRSRYLYFKKWRPGIYPLIQGVVFLRLLINTLFTLVGVMLTLNLNPNLKNKLSTYTQLIIWHLKGCPDNSQSKGVDSHAR